ncbi:MAG: type II toxin-antitoxin system RelE/ParE family toxin [Gemmatimonadetes bacterium]|nr:type II toxin-antitoxin system RelE/ParE family toxin [Gemmatimonadota bacterium]
MADPVFLPAAREEFLAAADRYDAASPGLGEEFIAEVERAVARLTTFPNHGNPYFGESRRIVLRRFPYDVVYLRSDQEIVVVAIAHQRRSPFYWRERI